VIRTGEEYRESIRAEREVYIKGEPNDLPTHQGSFPVITAAAVKKASA
jgi:aromatic ring hydroxylase